MTFADERLRKARDVEHHFARGEDDVLQLHPFKINCAIVLCLNNSSEPYIYIGLPFLFLILDLLDNEFRITQYRWVTSVQLDNIRLRQSLQQTLTNFRAQLFTLSHKPRTMADSLCGPSNALQNFQKHSTVDRTLQQDRLISRQSPSRVRSQKAYSVFCYSY